MRLATKVLCLAWLAAATSPAPGADRYLVVRYDDYAPAAYTYSAAPGAADAAPRPVQAAPDLEARLFDLFRRHHGRIVVGVIPFPIDGPAEPPRPPAAAPPAASWLSDADNPWVVLLRRGIADGTVEPALHGYEHRRNAPLRHRPGEFAGQPEDWQLGAIRQGRDALCQAIGRPVRVFVPPWNSWDAGTAAALDALGFAWCSADAYHAGYRDGRVRLVPQTASRPQALLSLLQGEQAAPPGSILVLTTHPFDFTGTDGQQYFQSLEELLRQVEADPDWACVGFDDLPEAPLPQWHLRFRQAVAWNSLASLARDMIVLPAPAPPSPPLFEPTESYASRIRPWRLAVAAVLAASAAAGLLAGWLLGRWPVRPAWARRAAVLPAVAALVLLAGAFAIASRGYHVRGIRWQAIAVMAGLSLGLAGARPRPSTVQPRSGDRPAEDEPSDRLPAVSRKRGTA